MAAAILAGCGGGGGGDAPPAPPSPPRFDLTVSVSGSGSVSSQPAGIDCGSTCTAAFDEGTAVTLTARAAASQSFIGWGGACAGSSSSCTVSVRATQSVTATFRAAQPASFTLTLAVTGNGTIRSQPAGIDCGSVCSVDFPAASNVTLTPTPGMGQTFSSWTGACAGAGTTCSVTMDQARSVGATFVATPAMRFRLSVTTSGSGVVRSDPAGIDCGATCAADFAANASVALTAAPAAGQVFTGWTGACSGTSPTCTVSMSQDRSAAATFAAAPTAPAWQTAQLLESSNDFNVTIPGQTVPVLSAIGPTGDAIVLWEQSDGTPDGDTRKVFSRRYVAGQGWDAAVQVPGLTIRSSTFDLVEGQLFLDGAGTATWIRPNLETRRFTAASGWGAPFAPVFNGAGGLSAAVMDANGNIGVLIAGLDVFNNALPANGTWGTWARVDNSGSEPAQRADVALSSDGSAMAVWREGNPGDSFYSLKAARYTPATGWQTPVTVDTSFDNVSEVRPKVAIDGAGNAIALWHQGGSIQHARYTPAGGWTAPTMVEPATLATSNPLHIVMAPNGRALLAWSSIAGATAPLRTIVYTPGSGFSAPAGVALFADNVTFAMDDDGNTTVVYTSLANFPNSTSANQDLYARRLPWGGVWSDVTFIDSAAGGVLGGAAAAFNRRGQGMVAWGQNDSTITSVRNSLWASVLR